jgi:hypothetical protein
MILRCTRPLAFSLLAALAVTGCVTMQAGSDYYREADFSGYRTYSWISDSPLIQSDSERVSISPLSVRQIREAIERELNGKGFTFVAEPQAADFAVSFTVGARDMISMSDYPEAYRGSWRWGAPYYWPNVDVYMYTEGMLAIDVFDRATSEPVWHGWARKQILSADIDDPQTTIDAAVSEILRDFPSPSSAEGTDRDDG